MKNLSEKQFLFPSSNFYKPHTINLSLELLSNFLYTKATLIPYVQKKVSEKKGVSESKHLIILTN